MPEGETARAFYDLTQELTEAAGLPAYEISNHAAPGEESRHNLLYWRYGEYAGIGPGAHGRAIVGGVRQATSTERNPERWAALVEERGHGLAETTALSPAEEADEALLMGMRLAEGLDLDRLTALTGFAPREAALADLARPWPHRAPRPPHQRHRRRPYRAGPGGAAARLGLDAGMRRGTKHAAQTAAAAMASCITWSAP